MYEGKHYRKEPLHYKKEPMYYRQESLAGTLASTIAYSFYSGGVGVLLQKTLPLFAALYKEKGDKSSDNDMINIKLYYSDVYNTASEVLAAEKYMSESDYDDGYDKVQAFSKIRNTLDVAEEVYKSKDAENRASRILSTVFASPHRFCAALLVGMLIFNGSVGTAPALAGTRLNFTDIAPMEAASAATEPMKCQAGQNEAVDVYESGNELLAYLSHIAKETKKIRESELRYRVSYIFLMANPGLGKAKADEYASYVVEAASKYEVPPLKLAGLIIKESTVDKDSRSRVGALGLTQVMPLHIRTLKKVMPHLVRSAKDLYNPRASIHAGAFMLKAYKDTYGRWGYALKRYLGIQKSQWDTKAGNYYVNTINKWESISKSIRVPESVKSNSLYAQSLYTEHTAGQGIGIESARALLAAEKLGNGLTGEEYKYITNVIYPGADIGRYLHKNEGGRYVFSAKSIEQARHELAKDPIYSAVDSSPLFALLVKIANSHAHADVPDTLLAKMEDAIEKGGRNGNVSAHLEAASEKSLQILYALKHHKMERQDSAEDLEDWQPDDPVGRHGAGHRQTARNIEDGILPDGMPKEEEYEMEIA